MECFNTIMQDEALRNTILQDTLKIEPWDELEKKHVAFVRDWIVSGAELFRIAKPATPNTHLVSYFVILDPITQSILLVDHKKAGLWLPAGGHVEAGERPKETVRREIQEELGIEADFLFEDPFFVTVTKTVGLTAGHTDVTFWYVLKGDSNLSIEFDKEEFHRISWFKKEELPYDRSDPHMSRFIAKLRKV
jgi:8-oxo-dGTP diphosphatase